MSVSTRPAASTSGATGSPTPVISAGLVAVAVLLGLALLLRAGQIQWPPHDLLASAYVVSGCLALVGPAILLRRSAPGGVGELVWLTAGLATWLFDLATVAQGKIRWQAWPTPLSPSTLGLLALAIMVAGWRLTGSAGKGWTWTNVAGWTLGLFWVGNGLYALIRMI